MRRRIKLVTFSLLLLAGCSSGTPRVREPPVEPTSALVSALRKGIADADRLGVPSTSYLLRLTLGLVLLDAPVADAGALAVADAVASGGGPGARLEPPRADLVPAAGPAAFHSGEDVRRMAAWWRERMPEAQDRFFADLATNPLPGTAEARVDRRPATVSEFAECVDAGACSARGYWGRAQDRRCGFGGEDGNVPMNCVGYLGAVEYCRWRGGRLASQAEWLRDASGPRSLPKDRLYCDTACQWGYSDRPFDPAGLLDADPDDGALAWEWVTQPCNVEHVLVDETFTPVARAFVHQMLGEFPCAAACGDVRTMAWCPSAARATGHHPDAREVHSRIRCAW